MSLSAQKFCILFLTWWSVTRLFLKVFVWKRYRLIPIICSGWRLNLIPSSPPPWPRPVSRSPTNRRPESREICKEPYRSDQLRFSYSIFQDFAYDLKRFPRIHPQDFGYLNFRADVINNFNGLCFTYKKQSDCLEVTRLVLIDLSAFFSLNLFMVWTVHCKEKTKKFYLHPNFAGLELWCVRSRRQRSARPDHLRAGLVPRCCAGEEDLHPAGLVQVLRVLWQRSQSRASGNWTILHHFIKYKESI